MATSKRIRELSKLPAIDIPYAVAASKYGGSVAALLDTLAHSSADAAKAMPPKAFSWKIVYDRAPDPPGVSDEQVFLAYLNSNSKAYLKASGHAWVDYEELPFTPPQIVALYEQRAKLVCSQRLLAKEERVCQAAPEPADVFDTPRANGQPLARKITAVVEMLRSLANDLENHK